MNTSFSFKKQPRKLKHKRRFCRVEGCSRIVKSQGVCQRHGAKPRSCKVHGCTKQAQGNYNGMCKAHARVIEEPAPTRLAEDKKEQILPIGVIAPTSDPSVAAFRPISYRCANVIADAKVNRNRRVCRVKGCRNVIKSQGVCQRHGARPVKCKTEGCCKQAQGNFKGMCKSHYQTFLSNSNQHASMPVGQHVVPRSRFDESSRTVSDEDASSVDAATAPDANCMWDERQHYTSSNYGEGWIANSFQPLSIPENFSHPTDYPHRKAQQSIQETGDLTPQKPISESMSKQPEAIASEDMDLNFLDLDDSAFEPVAFNPSWFVPI